MYVQKDSDDPAEPADGMPAPCGSQPAEDSRTSVQDGRPDEVQTLKALLEAERQHASECEEKMKRALADFQNLHKRSQSDIERGIGEGIDKFALGILSIRDEFVMAIKSYSKEGADTEGLDSILKNMDLMLKSHMIEPIDAVGAVFDPNLHEAVGPAVIDPLLDDETVVEEHRKGYISHNRTIRTSLVRVSKKSE